jgi:hypothetical protein
LPETTLTESTAATASLETQESSSSTSESATNTSLPETTLAESTAVIATTLETQFSENNVSNIQDLINYKKYLMSATLTNSSIAKLNIFTVIKIKKSLIFH